MGGPHATLGNNSGPRKPRKLCVSTACERCLRPPVGVSTLPFGPRCPSRDSYHVPCGGWTRCLARSTGSPAHPAAPGPPLEPWLAWLPWTRVSRTESLQLLSGKVAPRQLPGVRCARGALRMELLEEVWENARGVCGSAGALPQPRASEISSGRLHSLQSPCRLLPAQPPHFPESAGGGSSFHNKSPARGSGSHSRLKQRPRC